MADIYTVGLEVDATGLQRGAQQARAALTQVGQAESHLERQAAQTARALQTQAREAAGSAARLRDQARAAREASNVALADKLQAQARAFQTQAREARGSAAALREQERAAQAAARAPTGRVRGAVQGALAASGGVSGMVQGAIGGAVSGAAMAALQAGTQALTSVMQAATEAATSMLNLQNRFTAVAGSAQGGARMLTEVSALAYKLGVNVTELAANYASFSAAIRGTTLEGEKGRKAFDQISTGLARMGLNSETTSRALQALQQMVSKGTVAAEELRGQWGEAVPGGFQIAARAMGVTTQELSKLSEQGAITGETLVTNLGKQMASEVGPAIDQVNAGANRLNAVLTEVATTLLGPTVKAWDAAKGSLATYLSEVFQTSSALATHRERYRQWANATIEDAQRVTDAEIQAMEARVSTWQTEADRKLQITRDFQAAIRAARSLELGMDVPGGVGQVPTTGVFSSATATARTGMEAAQKQAAGIARFDRLSPELDKVRGQLKELEQAYADTITQMQAMPALEQSREFQALRGELEQQITTLRATETAIEDKAAADKKAEAATQSHRDAEVRRQLAAQETNLKLREGDEAAAAWSDRTAEMTETEQAAAAAGLRRASVIEAENRALARQNQITEEWKALNKQLQEAYDRAQLGEEGVLLKRIRTSGAPAAAQEAMQLLVSQTKAEEEISRQIERQNAFRTEQTELLEDLTLAIDGNLSLEDASARMAVDRLATDVQRKNELQDEYDLAQGLLGTYKAMAGLGTSGVGAEEAIQSFRDRGFTQGLVEPFGEAGPVGMDRAMETLTASTSRWDKSLQDAMVTLRVEAPEAVETFATLVEKKFGAIAEVSGQLTDTILSGLQDLTQKGGASFREFADSVIQDLLRILQQQFLAPQMEKWIEKGIGLGIQVLGGIFGGGAGVALPAGTTGLGTAMSGGFATSAVGGPLRSGLTLVGEAGPEVIASGGGRSMVFPTSHPVSRMAVAAHLPGRQFGGPLPSAVMGGTGSEVMSQPSASGPGQQAPVIVNVYAQDATSFLKSKGEVQRQMMAAWRSAQRS